MKGVVIKFDRNRGYGFISGEDGQSYFVHHSMILMEGFRYLVQDQQVEFEPVKEEKGLTAHEVKVWKVVDI